MVEGKTHFVKTKIHCFDLLFEMKNDFYFLAIYTILFQNDQKLFSFGFFLENTMNDSLSQISQQSGYFRTFKGQDI